MEEMWTFAQVIRTLRTRLSALTLFWQGSLAKDSRPPAGMTLTMSVGKKDRGAGGDSLLRDQAVGTVSVLTTWRLSLVSAENMCRQQN